MSKESIAAQVNAKGDEIREAKAAKSPKDVVMSLVEELKALKAQYEEIAGEPWPAPAAAPKKNKKHGGRSPALAPAPAPKAGGGGGAKEAITAKVTAKGDEIRVAKITKKDKGTIMSLVEELKTLKAEYENIAGEPWPTPAASPKNKKGGGGGQTPAAAGGELSKNAAKKAASKAAAAAKKKEKYGPGAKNESQQQASPAAAAATPAGGIATVPAPKGRVDGMSVSDVATVLEKLGLGEHKTKFAEAKIDGRTLIQVVDADLVDLGISDPSQRKKLQGKINDLLCELEKSLAAQQALVGGGAGSGNAAPARFQGKYLPIPAAFPPAFVSHGGSAAATVAMATRGSTKPASKGGSDTKVAAKKTAAAVVTKQKAPTSRPTPAKPKAKAPRVWTLDVTQESSGRWKLNVGKDSGRAGGGSDGTVSRSSMAVPIGHTSYSWSPPTTCATTPTGHTDFSWHVDTGTAGGDGLEGDLAELSAVLRAEKAAVITVGRAARSKQHALFMPCPFSLALGFWTLCHCLSASPSRHLLVLSSIVSSAIYCLLLPQLQAAIADKENLMLMKAQLAQEKQEMAALQAALAGGGASSAMDEVRAAQTARQGKLAGR